MDNGQWTIKEESQISNLKSQISNDKGQVILILILVMSVALSIGLSIVQKSLVDVSTASKVEQSSRAFSAAEAGIEKALQGDNSIQTFSDNSSQITRIDNKLNPCVPGSAGCARVVGDRQDTLEFPPLAKEDVAQVWLADYSDDTNPPPAFYTQSSLDFYWGTPGIVDPLSKPALEIKLVYIPTAANSQYLSHTEYLDSNSSRVSSNRFCDATNCNKTTMLSSCSPSTITTTEGLNRQFLCKSTLRGMDITNNILMLIRIRFLYNSSSQPFAVQAVGTCGTGCSLPPQARSITSIGISGETQRKVNLFQLEKVAPPYFDYAIFSSGDINK